MSQESSLDSLLTRLRSGDQDAATRLFNRYAHRLVRLAWVELDSVIRQKVDAEDVVQSVFRSFFKHQADGEWKLENWESLWGLLALITVRKCGRVERIL